MAADWDLLYLDVPPPLPQGQGQGELQDMSLTPPSLSLQQGWVSCATWHSGGDEDLQAVPLHAPQLMKPKPCVGCSQMCHGAVRLGTVLSLQGWSQPVSLTCAQPFGLQQVANANLTATICHLPPGTGLWQQQVTPWGVYGAL